MTPSQLVLEISRLALAHRDGRIAVLELYLDEAGVDVGAPVLVVAGYLARPETWRDWTANWSKLLTDIPASLGKVPIRAYHATDAQGLWGEFKGWTETERDALAIPLLKAIADSKIPGVMIGIHVDDYNEAMAPHPDLREMMKEPYGIVFNWVMSTLMNISNDHNKDEPMAVIHERNSFRSQAFEQFDWMKENANPFGTLTSLTFGDKYCYPPLQAADILAFEGSKRIRNIGGKERRAWTALDPDHSRLVGAYYNRKNMPKMIDQLQKLRDGRFSELDQGSGWKRAIVAKDGPLASLGLPE